MTERIRILLIDDHILFRESLVRLLEGEPDFEVAGRCATVAEGHEALAAKAVDIILLDYDLGDEFGTDLLTRLEGGRNSAKVILVTAGMRASAALDAVSAGVAGIVLKHSDPRQLVEAIRRVASGETWWDSNMVRAANVTAPDPANSVATVRSITYRQRHVLRSILDGLTNKEIAVRMRVSESSIKATIQELFSKAGVRTRGQLVRVAIERYSLDWLAEEQTRRT